MAAPIRPLLLRSRRHRRFRPVIDRLRPTQAGFSQNLPQPSRRSTSKRCPSLMARGEPSPRPVYGPSLAPWPQAGMRHH